MNIENTLNTLITPLTNTMVAFLNAVSRGLGWFMTNPVYAIGGLYVIAVALRGGNFKLGSKASTSVKS